MLQRNPSALKNSPEGAAGPGPEHLHIPLVPLPGTEWPRGAVALWGGSGSSLERDQERLPRQLWLM